MVEIQARSAASSASRIRSRRSPSASSAMRGERLADAAAELVGGALGEGEGEDPLDSHLGVERRLAEAVHQDRGLAGPGARAQEDVPVARLDRGALLLVS